MNIQGFKRFLNRDFRGMTIETLAALLAETGNGIGEVILLSSNGGHAHSVTLTTEQIASLAEGEVASVDITSTEDAGHTHVVTVTYADGTFAGEILTNHSHEFVRLTEKGDKGEVGDAGPAGPNFVALRLLTSLPGVVTNVNTKQALYTVPANKKAVPTFITVRKASASLGAISDSLQFGFNAGANDVATIGANQIAALVTSTQATSIDNVIAGTAFEVGNAGDVFGCLFNDPSVTATVTIDVFGYLTDASGVPVVGA